MVEYRCDWCKEQYPLNCITEVRLKNVYTRPWKLHICRECARSHMPESSQPAISWTAAD